MQHDDAQQIRAAQFDLIEKLADDDITRVGIAGAGCEGEEAAGAHVADDGVGDAGLGHEVRDLRGGLAGVDRVDQYVLVLEGLPDGALDVW